MSEPEVPKFYSQFENNIISAKVSIQQGHIKLALKVLTCPNCRGVAHPPLGTFLCSLHGVRKSMFDKA